jgi:phenylpropionate dioxygenase-like ring-hydroxylating dioxygenase large terminal subunit
VENVEPVALDARVEAPSATALKAEIPLLGLRNYWYPAIPGRKVKSKPVPVKLLGEELIFFRDERDGKVYALEDRCPHKGMPLSCARVYFPGTITCPYHGFTFNGKGDCVAVLSEGPDSKLPGKVRAKGYPVEERWGIVWVFVGELDPPPALEEDVPIEHFSDKRYMLSVQTWNHNWRDGMENTADASHAPILHRNALIFLFRLMPIYWDGVGVVETCNGKGVGLYPKAVGPYEAFYPGLGHYSNRRPWKIFTRRPAYRTNPGGGEALQKKSVFVRSEVRLPCWRLNNLGYWYVLATVPVDERQSRHFVFTFRNVSGMRVIWFKIGYYLWRRWVNDGQFIGQDKWVLERLKAVPEKLYKHDAGVIQWRQLAARAARQRI